MSTMKFGSVGLSNCQEDIPVVINLEKDTTREELEKVILDYFIGLGNNMKTIYPIVITTEACKCEKVFNKLPMRSVKCEHGNYFVKVVKRLKNENSN